MLTTKQLLAMTPKDAVAAMLNDNNPGLNLNGEDVLISQPVAVGTTLTQVTLTMRPVYAATDFVPYTGAVDFTYNRLDIANFAALAFTDFTPDLPTTTQILLDRLTQLYGCEFSPYDFVMEPITAASNGVYTLKTQPGSLRWVGTAVVTFGSTTLLFITGEPTQAIINLPYSYTFVGSGGAPGYTWSAQGLPTGLTINPTTGEVYGTPTALGDFFVTIIIVDAQGTQQQIGVNLNVVLATLVNPVLTIHSDFASATLGVAYQSDVLLTGSDGQYTVNPVLIQGAMPSGLGMSIVTVGQDSYLRMAGTPTTTYFGLIEPQVKGGDGQTVQQLQQYVVIPPVTVVGSYMDAESGKPFVDGLALTGGSGAYFLPTLTNGSVLPPGIDTLIVSDGYLEIRGNPTTPGTYPFDVIVLTGYGQSVTVSLSLTIVVGTPVSFGTPITAGFPQ